MTPKTVWAVYFSGTGTTERTVRSVAGELARMLSVPCRSIDFTRPQARQKELSFCERDLVVFGTPVYAGRVPNVLLPYLREKVRGGGALAVPVVLFGNRNYDDALIELRDLLVSAFLSGYGRADSEGLTRREYLDCSLRAIASMQVEPETVYCEEGTALQDELDLDHLEDGMHADGTWLYYGKPDEGFFFLLWFEDEGEAMTKQAQLSADPAVCCWLVDLEKDITTVE